MISIKYKYGVPTKYLHAIPDVSVITFPGPSELTGMNVESVDGPDLECHERDGGPGECIRSARILWARRSSGKGFEKRFRYIPRNLQTIPSTSRPAFDLDSIWTHPVGLCMISKTLGRL